MPYQGLSKRFVQRAIVSASALVAMMSSMPPAFAQPTSTDVQQAFQFLNTLGIATAYPDGPHLEDNLTRAQLAETLVRAVNQDANAKLLQGAAAFPDTASHWASGYIALVKNLGWMTAMSDGDFHPDDEVTVGELLGTVDNMLGLQVDSSLGYPTSVIQAAANAGINVDGMNAIVDEFATRGMTFYYVEQAMFVPNGSGTDMIDAYWPAYGPVLKSLSVSQGTLNFAPTTYSYTVTVDSSVYSVDVTALPYDPVATVTLGGITPTNSNTFTVPLNGSSTVSNLDVSLPGSGTTKQYSITFQKMTSSPAVNPVGDSDTTVTGTISPGYGIHVYVGNQLIGSGTAGGDGSFTVSIPAQKAGTILNVTATDTGGVVSQPTAVTVTDKTPPQAPIVNPVTDKDTTVTGVAEAGSTVTVSDGNKTLDSATAGSDGLFSVSVPPLTGGVNLTITATDVSGNVSQPTTITVKSPTPPQAPGVNSVGDSDTFVTGTAQPGYTVTVSTGNTVLASASAGTDGYFSVPIDAQKAGAVLSVTAVDANDNKSQAVKVTVQDKTPPGEPTVNAVHDTDSTLQGYGEPGATVTVTSGAATIGTGTIESDGSFTVSIPKQAAGTILLVTAADRSGNVSRAAHVTVTTGIPTDTTPKPPTVNPVFDTDKTVTGTAQPGTTVTVTANGQTMGSAIVGTDGNFSVTIAPQATQTTLMVTVADTAGHTSQPTTVKVWGDNCFIATAAFGSKCEPNVTVLRRFRDARLLTNPLGQSLVRAYYEYSPPVADFIRISPFRKAAVRTMLYPLVAVVKDLDKDR